MTISRGIYRMKRGAVNLLPRPEFGKWHPGTRGRKLPANEFSKAVWNLLRQRHWSNAELRRRLAGYGIKISQQRMNDIISGAEGPTLRQVNFIADAFGLVKGSIDRKALHLAYARDRGIDI